MLQHGLILADFNVLLVLVLDANHSITLPAVDIEDVRANCRCLVYGVSDAFYCDGRGVFGMNLYDIDGLLASEAAQVVRHLYKVSPSQRI